MRLKSWIFISIWCLAVSGCFNTNEGNIKLRLISESILDESEYILRQPGFLKLNNQSIFLKDGMEALLKINYASGLIIDKYSIEDSFPAQYVIDSIIRDKMNISNALSFKEITDSGYIVSPTLYNYTFFNEHEVLVTGRFIYISSEFDSVAKKRFTRHRGIPIFWTLDSEFKVNGIYWINDFKDWQSRGLYMARTYGYSFMKNSIFINTFLDASSLLDNQEKSTKLFSFGINDKDELRFNSPAYTFDYNLLKDNPKNFDGLGNYRVPIRFKTKGADTLFAICMNNLYCLNNDSLELLGENIIEDSYMTYQFNVIDDMLICSNITVDGGRELVLIDWKRNKVIDKLDVPSNGKIIQHCLDEFGRLAVIEKTITEDLKLSVYEWEI